MTERDDLLALDAAVARLFGWRQFADPAGSWSPPGCQQLGALACDNCPPFASAKVKELEPGEIAPRAVHMTAGYLLLKMLTRLAKRCAERGVESGIVQWPPPPPSETPWEAWHGHGSVSCATPNEAVARALLAESEKESRSDGH